MSWLLGGIWGALVGLDATSFPQAMISRPLVAGTVAGLLLGEPAAGAAIGIVLEVFAVSAVPFGAVRTPEPGTAAVAGTAAYAAVANAASGVTPALLLTAIVFALGWEHVGGWSVHLLRRVNERVVSVDKRIENLTAADVERRHMLALLVDFLRGGAVTVIGMVAGGFLLRLAGPPWPFAPELVLAVLGIGAIAILGSAVTVFGGWREHRVALGIGIGCGILALVLVP